MTYFNRCERIVIDLFDLIKQVNGEYASVHDLFPHFSASLVTHFDSLITQSQIIHRSQIRLSIAVKRGINNSALMYDTLSDWEETGERKLKIVPGITNESLRVTHAESHVPSKIIQ